MSEPNLRAGAEPDSVKISSLQACINTVGMRVEIGNDSVWTGIKPGIINLEL
jgi:hypothetical protein